MSSSTQLLTQAIRNKDTENAYRIITSLIIEAREAIPDIAVIFVAEQGNLGLMLTLKNNKVNMQTTTENGCTILHAAAYYGHEKIVSLLLEEKIIQVDVTDQYGRTPLNLAAESGHLEVVEILLKKRADINHCDKRNHTPLYSAIIGGHEKIKDMLLEIGVNFSCLLHLAAYYNQVEKVIKAVEGIEIYIDFKKNPLKQTPLHIAADCGHQVAVETLLKEYGAKINECDYKGYTPLDLATQNEHKQVAQYLLENGARSGKSVINSISLYLHRHQQRTHALVLFNALVLLEFNLIYLIKFRDRDDSKLSSATLGILLLATVWLWRTSPVWLKPSQASEQESDQTTLVRSQVFY